MKVRPVGTLFRSGNVIYRVEEICNEASGKFERSSIARVIKDTDEDYSTNEHEDSWFEGWNACKIAMNMSIESLLYKEELDKDTLKVVMDILNSNYLESLSGEF